MNNNHQVLVLNSVDLLKALGDPVRRELLCRLMSGPANLTRLALETDTYPAKIRHHLKQLEDIGLVKLVEERIVRGFVEKYYRASASAYYLNIPLTPHVYDQKVLLAMGSHDPALELLASRLEEQHGAPILQTVPIGSLDGLIALRQGVCQLAGCHLLDESGEYNVPFIRHLFPGEKMRLVTLAHRQQGMIVHPSRFLRIMRLEDITRPDVKFVNRRRGSGTRLWLDQQLARLGISAGSIKGYEIELDTHDQVAKLVADGNAHVGLGVYAAARQFDLGFIPLFEERFDLVFRAETAASQSMEELLAKIRCPEFQQAVTMLGGYNTKNCGEEINL